MSQIVHAVYEAGQFRPVDSIDLSEGQRVKLTIEVVDEKNAIRVALGDLIAQWPDESDDSDAYLESYAEEIDRAFQGEPPLSQIIIDSRERE